MPSKRKTTPAGYVAYYRVSTDKQGKSGLGLEAQKAAVERYLAGVKGSLLAEFVEVESGKKNDRPQLAAAIAQAKRLAGVLVIAKLDRLARNVAFIARLMEESCDFVACDMPHANKLTLHIMAAMAEHEREMISQRTKAALAEVKKRGVQLGNPRWEAALHQAHQARRRPRLQAQVLSLIAERRAKGDTLQAIADSLNDLKLTTPSGARWYPSSVRAALEPDKIAA